MRNPAYITIEECSGAEKLEGITNLILEEFPNIDINVIEDNEAYFVLHFIYDEIEEVQEVISTISYILISEEINQYKTTLVVND